MSRFSGMGVRTGLVSSECRMDTPFTPGISVEPEIVIFIGGESGAFFAAGRLRVGVVPQLLVIDATLAIWAREKIVNNFKIRVLSS